MLRILIIILNHKRMRMIRTILKQGYIIIKVVFFLSHFLEIINQQSKRAVIYRDKFFQIIYLDNCET